MAHPTAPGFRGLGWLLAIQLLSMGAMEMSGPFWPLHLRTLGQLPPQALAWASSAAYMGPALTAMLFTPLWGRVGDRIGHRPMVLRALLALAATQFVVALADSVALVLAARLAQGALGGFIAAAQAYGAGLVDRTQRARLMAKLQVATALGSAAGPWIGGLVFDAFGFATVNAAAAAVCLACFALALATLPAAARTEAGPAPAAAVAVPSACSEFAVLLAGIAVVQSAKAMPQAFFGVYAEQVLHASAAWTGLCYGATALGLCVAAPLWGRWFERLDRADALQRIEWICWGCAALLALQAASRELPVFLATRLLWGVALGALLPVFHALLSREADARSQGRVLGAGNGAAKAGALLGTAAGGVALGVLPIQQIFWPVAALYAAAALGLRLARPTTSCPTILEGKNET